MSMEQGKLRVEDPFAAAGIQEDKIVDPNQYGFVDNGVHGILGAKSALVLGDSVADVVQLHQKFKQVKSVAYDSFVVDSKDKCWVLFSLPPSWAGYQTHVICAVITDDVGDSRVHWWLVNDTQPVKLLLWVDVMLESRGMLTFYPEVKDALYRLRK